MINKAFIIIICLSIMPISMVVKADNLGTLFTSEQDRNKLNFIRNKPPEIETPVEEIVIEIPDIEEQEEEPIAEIDYNLKLKGLVYRKNGKSTAWINDGNTYEGNLETQFLQVNESDINDGSVNIVMPDKETRIQLKVGDNYIPRKDDEQQDPIVEE